MLIRNEYGSLNPSLLVKICLQFLPSGESTTTVFDSLPATYTFFKGTLIDRVNIPGKNATRISLRDDTIKFTDWRTNTIYCYTLAGQQIWTFKEENVLRIPRGIALDINKNVYVAGRESKTVVVLSPDGKNRSINVPLGSKYTM
jgi:outer membrane protein assembly factor BamB